MVTVDVAEEAGGRLWFVWKSSKVVYPDSWELFDVAIEGRHIDQLRVEVCEQIFRL